MVFSYIRVIKGEDMKTFLLSGVILLGMLLNVNMVKAQDEGAAGIEEDLEYTYGSVVSSTPTEIVVSEYNYETDEEVQVTYTITPETKFSNIPGAADLAKDDNVDIYYKVADDKKIASMVTKDDTVYESEVAEGEDVAEDLSDEAPDPQTNAVNEVPTPVSGNETDG
jgi:hypothetical protein